MGFAWFTALPSTAINCDTAPGVVAGNSILECSKHILFPFFGRLTIMARDAPDDLEADLIRTKAYSHEAQRQARNREMVVGARRASRLTAVSGV